MRHLWVFAGGLLMGMAIAMVFFPGRAPVPGPPTAPGVGAPGAASLHAELSRARSEIAALRRALDRAPAAAAAAGPGRSGAPAAEPPAALDERRARAREALELLESDPGLLELFARHSREESGFPHWIPAQFLDDPAVNPAGLDLEPERRGEFDLRFARTFHAIRALDLRRQLLIAGALERKIDERLRGVPEPPPDRGELDAALTISLPGGHQVSLSREEFPEIHLLDEEKRAAVVGWLLEAQRFFSE